MSPSKYLALAMIFGVVTFLVVAVDTAAAAELPAPVVASQPVPASPALPVAPR